MINIRDLNRLNDFYNEVTRLHMIYFPNWRIGQFWMNFLKWMHNEKRRDLFFSQDDKMLTYLKEFCGEEV